MSFSSSSPRNNRKPTTTATTATATTSPSSSFTSWIRKSLFGSSSSSSGADGTFSPPPPLYTPPPPPPTASNKPTKTELLYDDADDAEEGGTQECVICTTVANCKLATSLPCHHKACTRCWSAWAKAHEEKEDALLHCLICAQPVSAIRFPAQEKTALERADDLFEDTLRIVLDVKNSLLDVEAKLGATENHLAFLHEAVQMGELDADALLSIIQVELVVVKEQLQTLLRIASKQLTTLPDALGKLNEAMRVLFVKLHEFDAGEGSTLQPFCDMLETERARGNGTRHTTLKAQWDAVFTLLASLLDASVVNIIAFMVPSEADSIARLMEKIKQRLSGALPSITSQSAEFEALALRFVDRVHDEQAL